MNGAESLVHSLLRSGVTTCFSNPGTSEMHFVAALDRVPGMHCVLGLFEGVVTGAADGYARMAGKPAATLLHCGPGLANGLANLHNARRAATPVVNIVGDQATYHRPLDPPLTADTEGWARGVSGWVRTSNAASTVGSDAAAAVQASMIAPGQVATLILPSDTSWNDGGVVAEALPRLPPPSSSPNQIEASAEALRRGGAGVVLLLGGVALYEEGLALAHRIQAATGCRVIAQGSNARMARGQGRLSLERVPYVVDVAVRAMAGTKHLILVGSRKPVTFFAYPNTVQSSIPDDAEIHILARPEQDVVEALARLVDALDCPKVAPPDNGMRPETGRGALTAGFRRRHARCADAGERGHRRRICQFRAWFLCQHQGVASPRLAERNRRGNRGRHADGDRCGARCARTARDQPSGRRIGDVHPAGAVDAGAGEIGHHHRPFIKPKIPNPAG